MVHNDVINIRTPLRLTNLFFSIVRVLPAMIPSPREILGIFLWAKEIEKAIKKIPILGGMRKQPLNHLMHSLWVPFLSA